ncbi:MAG: exodeoxyribonuclease V subunit alpha [Sandaracinus sp.]|nr:exodeoxyribonuclease V subunit alpha [Sandaracinus sp.]MCB9611821.1 exodeoxyribonuclease V subunit alpha [Sandaracinus sp.]
MTSETKPSLDPSGTARVALVGEPSLSPSLVEHAAALDLAEGELALGLELARFLSPSIDAPRRRAFVGLVAALRLAETRGSTRLPLAGGALDESLDALGLGDDERALASSLVAELATWAPVVGRPGMRVPLVVDDGALASARLFVLETRVAEAVRARLAVSTEVPPALDEALADVLARSPKGVVLSEAQRAAVRSAALGRLALVSGEPGTGKTSIVVSMLRVLVRLGVNPEHVALAAPTGKAADRMRGSITRALEAIEDPSDEDRALRASVPESQTLHRLLGYSPSTGRWRHHERNPLGQRVILVDESSMIGVALVDRLLRAAAPDARVVLLGDAQQLPSVDAGAVFRDLCAALADHPSRPVARLTESYRMSPTDPAGRHVLGVARAMNVGDLEEVVREVRRPASWSRLVGEGVERVEGRDLSALLAAWERLSPSPEEARRAFSRRDGRFDAEGVARLEQLFVGLERTRILCVTRGRRTGVVALNELAHARHLARGGRERGPRLSAGEPVLVTRNDYERGLYNGDQGLVVLVRDGHEAVRRVAVFRRGEGDFVAFPVETVEARLELAYAVTVHKAQGSEHDRVAVVLPDEPVPLLTRELLYTAVTRARKHVVLFGDEARLREGVERRVDRQSALGAKLR